MLLDPHRGLSCAETLTAAAFKGISKVDHGITAHVQKSLQGGFSQVLECGPRHCLLCAGCLTSVRALCMRCWDLPAEGVRLRGCNSAWVMVIYYDQRCSVVWRQAHCRHGHPAEGCTYTRRAGGLLCHESIPAARCTPYWDQRRRLAAHRKRQCLLSHFLCLTDTAAAQPDQAYHARRTV